MTMPIYFVLRKLINFGFNLRANEFVATLKIQCKKINPLGSFWIVSKEEKILIEWRLKEFEIAMECILKSDDDGD